MSEFLTSSAVQWIALVVGVISVVGFLLWLSEWAGGGGRSHEVEYTVENSGDDPSAAGTAGMS